jgi:glycosyltransferase involved in cell wall biosynthesis
VTSGPPSRPLRILVVNWLDRENPKSGGAEVHLHETFGRLVARGHEVSLLASGWSGCAPRATLDGIDVHRAGARYTFSFAGPRYFRRHMAAQPYDVVVEDLNKVPLFTRYWAKAPVALLVHHLFGVTAFQEAHIPLATATWLLERPIPWVFRDTPAVAVSESTKEDLVDRGLRAERIEVIPNGIELERFTPHPQAARTPSPTVLYIGRLQRYKHVDLLIRGMKLLIDDGVDVRLRVAGAGDDRPNLESLVAKLGIGDSIEFLGFVTEEQKLDLLRTSWLHAITSPKDGWGISCMEAGACGTATVASDSPGLRESVVDKRTGILVPHGDLPALAQALRSLIDDRERREEMGRQARLFAEGFSWDASAEAMEDFLRRVVAQSGPR